MIQLNCRDSRPIYEQVKDGLRQLIINGVLTEGSRLPSVRELAVSLTINPNTIQRAYRELEAEGYTVPAAGEVDFSLLSGEAEQALIKKIAAYSQVVRLAARDYDPSHINRYLTELAGDFHRFYTACRIKGEERPVLLARLKLADTARSVLKNAMTLIGCTAPEKM